MGNRLLGARQETREEQLEHELARLRSRLSTAERGWKREYEWRRKMENFIREYVAYYYPTVASVQIEFHARLLKRIPLKPRKKFGRR